MAVAMRPVLRRRRWRGGHTLGSVTHVHGVYGHTPVNTVSAGTRLSWMSCKQQVVGSNPTAGSIAYLHGLRVSPACGRCPCLPLSDAWRRSETGWRRARRVVSASAMSGPVVAERRRSRPPEWVAWVDLTGPKR
jgi:hypothetical protein